jgi:hypothetical protein
MNKEVDTLSLSIKDLFTSKMLKYSLMPFVLSMIIMYIIFFIGAGYGLEQLGTMNVETTQTTVVNGVEHTDSFAATLEGTALIQFLMSNAITSWIATFLVYTVGSMLTLYFSIFIAVIIVGFLTPYILKEIQQRHYKDIEMIGYSNIAESLIYIVKWVFVMIIMFIVFVPLYFIPLVNIIAFNLPLYYFFHKMMTYDVSSNICTKDEAMKIKFFNANSLRIKTLALYIISMIPFVVFFASVFYIIYLGHIYFIETKKLRDGS